MKYFGLGLGFKQLVLLGEKSATESIEKDQNKGKLFFMKSKIIRLLAFFYLSLSFKTQLVRFLFYFLHTFLFGFLLICAFVEFCIAFLSF